MTRTATETRTATPTYSDSPTRTVTRTVTETFSSSPTPSHSPTITYTHTPVQQAALQLPFPNPMRPLKGEQMTLPYQVSSQGYIRLKVYNLAGELVRKLVDADLPNGTYAAVWDGRNQKGDLVSSGLYLVLFESSGAVQRNLVGVLK